MASQRVLLTAFLSLLVDEDIEEAASPTNQPRKSRKPSKDWLLDRTKRWVNQINPFYEKLFLEDPKKFVQTFPMKRDSFENLLSLIGERITKTTTNLRRPIPPKERLFATLRFLGTGMGYKQLENETRIASSTLAYIVPDTCRAIASVLGPLFAKVPDTEEEWKKISSNFLRRWQYPKLIGCLDGKHYQLRCPEKSGSQFHNYKGTFSVLVLAISDAFHRILYFKVGMQGSSNDSGAWLYSDFREALESSSLQIPTAPEGQVEYHLAADGAFPLSDRMMVPYQSFSSSGKEDLFNYQLSRARRIIEGSFGMISARFRLFQTSMNLKPKNAQLVISACFILHNFLLSVEPFKRPDLPKIQDPAIFLDRVEGNFPSKGYKQRAALCDFFSAEGSVAWQIN